MADRRRSFRFWTRRTPSPPPTARPSAVTSTTAPPTLKTTNSTPATKPAAQTQPIAASTVESPPVSRQPTTSTSPPTTKSQIPPPLTNSTPKPEKPQTTSRQPTTTATPPPPAETPQNPTSPRKPALDPPPPIEKQTATQPANSAPNTRPTVESPPVSRRPTTSTSPPPSTKSQNKPPTPTNSTPTPEKSQTASRPSTTTATPPPPAETSSKTPQSPTSPRTPALDPPPIEKQTATQPTTTTLTSPTDEPKISSPSTPTTKSPNSSKPIASPSRPTPQSRSPPPPSFPSPSRPARPITSSSPSRKTPSTPQRAPQPRSPSRLTSKQLPPNSPSKESRQIAQTARASNEKDAKPATTQQEPRINGVEETNEVNEISPSKLTTTDRKSDPPTISYERGPHIELKANPEETKDVMEVAEATKIEEASEETKKKANDFLNPKPDEVQTEKHEVREREKGLHTNNTTSQPNKISTTSQPNKISTNSHNKPAPTIEQHISLNKDIRDDISTFVNQTATGDPKNATNEKNVSIITLAGENRGASMQMGPTSKEGPVHIHRGYKKVNSRESGETTTDEEGNFKGEQSKDAKATEDQPTEAYVNNNAQGINNSIVFNASIAERDPGVHMIVTHIPKEQMWPAEKKMSPLEPRKAEFNISRAEKLTYEEPTVRRRCLRGLFMETSDSDQENSEKPRRHGCRVGCKLKEKENGIDVL